MATILTCLSRGVWSFLEGLLLYGVLQLREHGSTLSNSYNHNYEILSNNNSILNHRYLIISGEPHINCKCMRKLCMDYQHQFGTCVRTPLRAAPVQRLHVSAWGRKSESSDEFNIGYLHGRPQTTRTRMQACVHTHTHTHGFLLIHSPLRLH